jgi:hypothetical protein
MFAKFLVVNFRLVEGTKQMLHCSREGKIKVQRLKQTCEAHTFPNIDTDV